MWGEVLPALLPVWGLESGVFHLAKVQENLEYYKLLAAFSASFLSPLTFYRAGSAGIPAGGELRCGSGRA